MVEEEKAVDELQSLINQLGDTVRKDFAKDPLSVLGIPPIKGYAPVKQHQVAESCLLGESMTGRHWVGGIDLSDDILEFNKYEEKVESFLKWCKLNLGICNLLHPYGQWHITPSEVFGKENVIHLSDDNYLEGLRERMRVKSDPRQLPFNDHVFDGIYLGRWDVGWRFPTKIFDEFSRVVKEDGIFIVEDNNNKRLASFVAKKLERIIFPQEVENVGQEFFALYKNRYKV